MNIRPLNNEPNNVFDQGPELDQNRKMISETTQKTIESANQIFPNQSFEAKKELAEYQVPNSLSENIQAVVKEVEEAVEDLFPEEQESLAFNKIQLGAVLETKGSEEKVVRSEEKVVGLEEIAVGSEENTTELNEIIDTVIQSVKVIIKEAKYSYDEDELEHIYLEEFFKIVNNQPDRQYGKKLEFTTDEFEELLRNILHRIKEESNLSKLDPSGKQTPISEEELEQLFKSLKKRLLQEFQNRGILIQQTSTPEKQESQKTEKSAVIPSYRYGTDTQQADKPRVILVPLGDDIFFNGKLEKIVQKLLAESAILAGHLKKKEEKKEEEYFLLKYEIIQKDIKRLRIKQIDILVGDTLANALKHSHVSIMLTSNAEMSR